MEYKTLVKKVNRGMYAFKIVTTTLNVLIMGILFFFMNGLEWKKDRKTVIGFSAIELLYLINILCMWW